MKLPAFLPLGILLLVLTGVNFPLSAEAAGGWQVSQLPVKASLRSSAATKKTLWVAGSKNRVYLSKNSGKSWLDVSPELTEQHDFRDIEVLNEDTAIVMSAGEGEKSKLFITQNQGKSWQLLKTNRDEKGFYDSIAFTSQQQGFLLGDPVAGHFVLEHTQDQGKSWQRIDPTRLPPLSEHEVAFAASGNTLVALDSSNIWFTSGGLSAFIYHSRDGGRHWQKQPLPLYRATKTAGPYALAFNSRRQLFALGGDYLERDGSYANIAAFSGEKWQLTDSGQHGLRTAMSCIKSTCLATGKLSTDISYDHGSSWQAFDQKGFYTLAANNAVILAAGAEGKVAVFTPRETADNTTGSH
ncbi:oxidoreductase [Thalassomonas viridans]|uniref:Oxidoreductase n=1 Tax=Thalassomonas viridans TaxID=137584 RepID=A0AAF0CAE9_9GAMM|nr:YCF48-related protein [Thalassomonas viridans]WDE06240.1 oxidoreductase [Thalassomonas viridans]